MWIGYLAWAPGGVAGSGQRPHEVGEALLGADGRDDLPVGVELHVELPR